MSSSSSSTSSSSTSSSSTSLALPSLKHFWYTLRDNRGKPRGGELVTVYVYDDSDVNDNVVLAELYDEVGLPLSNPVTTSTESPTAASGAFEFYLKDEMWGNISPSADNIGYEWSDRIKLAWDNEGDVKSADRIMTWGDYHPIYDTPFDPMDWSQIDDPSGESDVNDKNKAISNSLAYQIECHIAKELEEDLVSSTSSSSSSVSSSSTSSSSSSLSSSSSSSTA